MGRLTKFEGERISCNVRYCPEDCNICEIYKDIRDKLAHYEDLEEQGRLIELPCAVGDTVWFVGVQHNHYFITEYAFEIFMFDDIGNRIFLTKEEAEAKLKELEG